MENRIDWIDSLKFLGILAIYCGHMGANTGRLFPFVWQYHVPLMFLCAGFFAQKGKTIPFKKFLFKLTSGILVPYYIFAVLSLAVYLLLNPTTVREFWMLIVYGLVGCKRIPYAEPLWFLPALYFVEIAYYFLLKLNTGCEKRNLLLRVLTCFACSFGATVLSKGNYSVYVPLCINFSFQYFVYYAVGNLVDELLITNNSEKAIKTGEIVNILSIFIGGGYALSVYFGIDVLTMLPGGSNIALNYVLSLIRILLLCSANYAVAKVLSKSKTAVWFGRNTLYLCGNEVIVKLLFSYILLMLGLPTEQYGELEPILYSMLLFYVVLRYMKDFEASVIFCVNEKFLNISTFWRNRYVRKKDRISSCNQ